MISLNNNFNYNQAPSIDLNLLSSIPGLDLTKPLTKETAEELNYAIANNNTFPEETMVKIVWNEETNECELSIRCTTGFSTTAESKSRYGQPLDDYDLAVDLANLGITEHKPHEREYVPEIITLKERVQSGSGSSGNRPQTDTELNLNGTHNYGLVETHTFKIKTDGTLNDAFSELQKDVSSEKWKYVKLNESKPDWLKEQRSYKEAFNEGYDRNPSFYEYNGYAGETTNDIKTKKYDSSGSYHGAEDDQLIVKNGYDKTASDGFMPAGELEKIVHSRKCDEIRQKTADLLSSDLSSVEVNYVNGKYEVNVYGELLTFNESDFDSISTITDDITKKVSDGIFDKNNSEYDLVRAQVYINQHITDKEKLSTGDIYFYKDNSSSDMHNIVAKKYNLNISDADLANYDNPNGPIQAIINASNLQNELNIDNNEASIRLHQKDNKIIYECFVNGEKNYFIYEDGVYCETDSTGDKIGETKTFNVADYYKKNNESKTYYYTNSRLSRRQNSGICAADEERYNEIIQKLNSVEITTKIQTPILDDAIGTINKYYKTNTSSVSETIIKLDNDISLLSKLISSIVNLYIYYDADLKDILDGLITGSDDSLADRLFGFLKNGDSSEYTEEKFKEEFMNQYNKYVDDLRQTLLVYKNMQAGEIPLDIISDDSEEYKELVKMMKTKGMDPSKIILKKNGGYYLNYSDYGILFADYLGDSSKQLVNDNVHDALISGPTTKYSIFANNYNLVTDCVKNFNHLSSASKYVSYLFDEGFKKELEYVRNNGKTSSNYFDEWMTPVELAMYQHLHDNHYTMKFGGPNVGNVPDYGISQEFKSSFSSIINERKGRYEAAQTVLKMIEDGIGWNDYLGRNLWGLLDGFTKTANNIYHAFDHNTQDYEWTRYYITKFISDEYDLGDVIKNYNSGSISNKEYELTRKLAGAEGEKYQLNGDEKYWLNASYDIGTSFGDSAFSLALMAATAGAGGSAVLARIARYGTVFLSSFGDNMHSKWDSTIHDSSGEYWSLFARSAGKATNKTVMQVANDYMRAKIKKGTSTPKTPTPDEATVNAGISAIDSAKEAATKEIGGAAKDLAKKSLADTAKGAVKDAAKFITDSFKKTKYPKGLLEQTPVWTFVKIATAEDVTGAMGDLAVATAYKYIPELANNYIDTGDFATASKKAADKTGKYLGGSGFFVIDDILQEALGDKPLDEADESIISDILYGIYETTRKGTWDKVQNTGFGSGLHF